MSDDRRFFVDTNVFLYACDAAEPLKSAGARQWIDTLWESGSGRISWQVLHEYYVNATRKKGVAAAAVRATVETLAVWKPVDSSLGLTQQAWQWTDVASVSYWDALIVAAAERSGCAYLLSEDMQEGRRFGGVLVVNPFLHGPEEYGLRRLG